MATPVAEDEIPWFLLLTPEVISAVLTALGILILVALVGVLVLYGSLRRSGRWDRALLVLRSRYDDGPRGEVAQLRLRLLDALASTRRAVGLDAADGIPSGELAGSQRRLERLAVPLDGQLRLLRSETDEMTLRRMLGPARERVREFEDVARRLRETASVQLSSEITGELPEIGAAAERELTALRAGIDALDRLRAGAEDIPSVRSRSEGEPRSRKERAQ